MPIILSFILLLITINQAQQPRLNLNNLNNNQLQRLLTRLNALTQDNGDIDPDTADLGPASLAQIAAAGDLDDVIDPDGLTTTFTPVTTFSPTTTFGLEGDFFSTRFEECQVLRCGDERQDCCIDNIRAFCCPRPPGQEGAETADDADVTEGRRFRRGNRLGNGAFTTANVFTPIEDYNINGIVQDYNAPLQDYTASLLQDYTAPLQDYTAGYNAYNAVESLFLNEGQICLRDADCDFDLLCEIDVSCLINNSFRRGGMHMGGRGGMSGRRGVQRRLRRRRQRIFGFNTACPKICTASLRI
eukprot:134426_1